MKIEENDSFPKLYLENCKNTRDDGNGMKDIKCICGCTRIEARISASGEGAGCWLDLTCKRCGKTLYYNGA
jgi:hypothetical protein